jgi:glycosyltransferase, group 1 family
MTLYINGQCLERSLTGVERYTLAVLYALDKLLDEIPYAKIQTVLLVPPHVRYKLQFQKIKVKRIGRFGGIFWEQIELPFYCRNEFLLSLHSVAPLMHRRQLIVMHDAKVAHKGKLDTCEARRYWYKFLGKTLGRRLPKIIAISHFTAQDIHKGFGIPYNKIKVVLSGPYDLDGVCEDRGVLTRYGLQSGQFILGVGGGTTKNNILTARAVETLTDSDLIFVLAGSAPKSVQKGLAEFKRTRCIGRVTNEELLALYKNAFCLAFPSLVEGFGIPPLEAMAVGCPVIASTCEAIPEVCGDAVLYVDSYNVDSMKKQIARLLHDQVLVEQLIEKGYENLRRFDWDRTAKEILDETIKVMA